MSQYASASRRAPGSPSLVGLVARRLVVRVKDVAFLKGIVEAHEGLAQLHAERGGDVMLVTTRGREQELDELVRDLALELDGIVPADERHEDEGEQP